MNSQGTYAQYLVIQNPTALSADGLTWTGWGASIAGNVSWLLKTPKAVVCHAPGNDPNKARTIDVSFPDGLNDHLAHGDTVGLCQSGGE